MNVSTWILNMDRRVFLSILVIGCIVTGCLNSLLTKYQDNQCVENCSDANVENRVYFEQPVMQTLQMFIGEFACILVYKLISFNKKGSRSGYVTLEETPGEQGEVLKYSMFGAKHFSVPAICDLTGTTLVNLGLLYTPVSVYQMMRGSLVLFVALLSVAMFKKRTTKLEWVSLTLVTLGIFIVGIKGSQNSESVGVPVTTKMVIFGILIIILGEFSQAFQFLFEERLMEEHPIAPIQVVYTEGFYGCIITAIVAISLNIIFMFWLPEEEFANSPFNLFRSIQHLLYSKEVFGSSILIMISISSFNFFGISLTSELSATSRSTIDTCRTLLVWLVAILMGWESLYFMQVLGFGIMVFGTLCFNKVLEPEDWDFVPSLLKT